MTIEGIIEFGGMTFRRSTVQLSPIWGEKKENYKVHGCLVEDEEGTIWAFCGMFDTDRESDIEETAGPITCKRCLRVTGEEILRVARRAVEALVG